ncbi:D-alanine--poly(phosphoribitol) ligase subunit DltC [Atopobacter sp. AH10]|uniref:D-alanine--poly(phosphoribitol) ligase subunit DltC n=1 Tax=Atopobacter sp. AH10 TaxID=2315861 RepID=UPI000EF2018E|nr:D-alanine--poly(phosphoribitol) ligase subunit DltC [Atopobacter sp. AH10]RLK63111.1 D-alanine--poly(phosphoribitol) ligase subunit DltC [Atopobacter sp. AH10]
MENIREKVLAILAEVCGDEVVIEEPDINIVDEGLIDSFGYMELLVSLESELGVVIAPTEYTREEMDTPSKIASIVEGKC